MNKGVAIALAAAVLAVLLLIVWIRLRRRRKRRQEMRRQAEDRLREEALDRVLTGRTDGGKGGPSVPFDVKYDVDQRKRSEQTSRIAASSPLMLQLTEHSELSTRKYMLHVADRVTLGQASRNDIVIKGARIADDQCEIFRIKKTLYVKNTGTSGMVFLSRKNHKIMVDAQAVTLEDKDKLQIGGYTYEVELLRG